MPKLKNIQDIKKETKILYGKILACTINLANEKNRIGFNELYLKELYRSMAYIDFEDINRMEILDIINKEDTDIKKYIEEILNTSEDKNIIRFSVFKDIINILDVYENNINNSIISDIRRYLDISYKQYKFFKEENIYDNIYFESIKVKKSKYKDVLLKGVSLGIPLVCMSYDKGDGYFKNKHKRNLFKSGKYFLLGAGIYYGFKKLSSGKKESKENILEKSKKYFYDLKLKGINYLEEDISIIKETKDSKVDYDVLMKTKIILENDKLKRI